MEIRTYRAAIDHVPLKDSYGEGQTAFEAVVLVGHRLAVRKRYDMYRFGMRSETRERIDVLGWGAHLFMKQGVLKVQVCEIPLAHDLIRRKVAARFGLEPDAVTVM